MHQNVFAGGTPLHTPVWELTVPLAARTFVVMFAEVVQVNAPFVQKNWFIDQVK